MNYKDITVGIVTFKSDQVIDDCIQSYRNAIGINPNYYEACNNLAVTLRESKSGIARNIIANKGPLFGKLIVSVTNPYLIVFIAIAVVLET